MKSAFFLLLLTSPVWGQAPRPSVMVDATPTTSAYQPAVATRNDLSAVVWTDGSYGGSNTIQICLSDGRGVDWTPVVRIDGDPAAIPTAKYTSESSVQIVGDNVYVAWEDARFGNRELFLVYSNDRGLTWSPEIWIDKGSPAGTDTVFYWEMKATDDSAGGLDHLYFLFSITPSGFLDQDLYFLASHDGGMSFATPALYLPQGAAPGTADVYHIDMVANDQEIYVLWQDDRFAPTVYEILFQRSLDGGATWLPADRRLNNVAPGSADTANIHLSHAGPYVLAAWGDERTSGGPQDELRVAISTNRGITWGADMLVGNYVPGVDDIDYVHSRVINGNFFVTWNDDRGGAEDVYVAQSFGPGGPFFEWAVPLGPGNDAKLVGTGEKLAVHWRDVYGAGFAASYSRDGGANWQAGFGFNDTLGPHHEGGTLRFNGDYGNFIAAWLADDLGFNNTYVGGFRPQHLVPIGGFHLGDPIYFEAHHFPQSEEGWQFAVLMSEGLGNFPLGYGDGRNTGLLDDAFLRAALAYVPGLLSGTIGVGGSGATPTVFWPLSLPSGHLLYLTAVSFDLSGGGVSQGALTDVFTLVMP
ncbi:MAG: exo-alpha-sialidase [Planctomycetota bacterium]|nr:MAG: exo-alpha-sialidase [Planctomycetota bacterium]